MRRTLIAALAALTVASAHAADYSTRSDDCPKCLVPKGTPPAEAQTERPIDPETSSSTIVIPTYAAARLCELAAKGLGPEPTIDAAAAPQE